MDTFEDFREVIRLTAIGVISAVAAASVVIAVGSSPHPAPGSGTGDGAGLVKVSALVGEPGR